MSGKYLRLLLTLVLAVTTTVAYGEQVNYKPGPFQGTDVWFGNTYNQSGVNDDKLQAGGWGDEYDFLIRFDLEGLPRTATQAIIWLAPFARGDSSTLAGMRLYRVLSSWSESTGLSTRPSSSYVTTYVPPTLGYWYGLDITDIYNGWKNGAYANWGLEYRPASTNNEFSQFRSSDYSTLNLRPWLQVSYTPTVTPPLFKTPLPGGKYWMVTTEIGGKDCLFPNDVLASHTGLNYFSIDFGQTSLLNGVARVETDVPILAAAGGRVITATHSNSNGNYVVIDHDAPYDGNGFTTRYLHLREWPSVAVGQDVPQGKVLGIMGDTGEAYGVHLHFGVRYNNAGNSSVNELAFVKMESSNLKSYMTECANGQRIRFNYSSNVAQW